MTSRFNATVHYEDGTTADVTIGQRELAAVEATPFGMFARTLLKTRYAAYDALRRTGRLPRDSKGQPITWETWSDRVPEVTAEDDEQEAPDPTRPDQPAES